MARVCTLSSSDRVTGSIARLGGYRSATRVGYIALLPMLVTELLCWSLPRTTMYSVLSRVLVLCVSCAGSLVFLGSLR